MIRLGFAYAKPNKLQSVKQLFISNYISAQPTFSMTSQLTPIYWISGDEIVLIRSALESLRKKLQAEGFAERQVFHEESNFDWQAVQFELESLSLFSTKKIVEIHLKSGKLSVSGIAVLQSLIDAKNQDNIVILITPKLEQAVSKSNWFQKFSKNLTHIALWPPSPAELPRWIKQQFHADSYQASDALCKQLATHTANDLVNTANAIELLKLHALNKTIAIENLHCIEQSAANNSVYALIDAALSGDAIATINMFRLQQEIGTEPLFIVNLLARESRQLCQLVERCEAEPFVKAVNTLKIWPKRQTLYKNALQRLSKNKLMQMHQEICEMDQIVKGLVTENFNIWIVLERFLLRLCGKSG